MFDKVHNIKQSLYEICAEGITQICSEIEEEFKQHKYTQMVLKYRHLLVQCCRFRKCCNEEYKKSKHFSENKEGSINSIPLPFGWKIEEVSQKDIKIVPPSDYLELAEEAETLGKRYSYESNGNSKITYENYNSREDELLSLFSAKAPMSPAQNSESSDEESKYLSICSHKEVPKPRRMSKAKTRGPRKPYNIYKKNNIGCSSFRVRGNTDEFKKSGERGIDVDFIVRKETHQVMNLNNLMFSKKSLPARPRALKSISKNYKDGKKKQKKYCPAGLVDVRKKKTVEIARNSKLSRKMSNSVLKARIKKTTTLAIVKDKPLSVQKKQMPKSRSKYMESDKNKSYSYEKSKRNRSLAAKNFIPICNNLFKGNCDSLQIDPQNCDDKLRSSSMRKCDRREEEKFLHSPSTPRRVPESSAAPSKFQNSVTPSKVEQREISVVSQYSKNSENSKSPKKDKKEKEEPKKEDSKKDNSSPKQKNKNNNESNQKPGGYPNTLNIQIILPKIDIENSQNKTSNKIIHYSQNKDSSSFSKENPKKSKIRLNRGLGAFKRQNEDFDKYKETSCCERAACNSNCVIF